MKRVAGATLAAALLVAPGAQAQDFPARTVRVIVPSSPGGGIDSTARVVSARLAELWGQSTVIENRAGGSMIIGAEAAAKSRPDGYTLFFAHDGTMSMNPVVFPKLPYDPQRDFVPLSLVTAAPLILVVHPSVGVASVRELIAYARANPGRLNHATGGTATLLALELFKAFAKVEIASVNYKGLAPANASLLAGETQLGFPDLGSGAAALRTGKLRLVAVADARRSKFFPDVPTFAEAGLPGYETRTWVAAFAPAGTPPAVSAKIENDIRRALSAAEVRERLERLNFDVVGSSGEELARVMRADTEKWGKLIRERGLKLEQ
ncbi:MAG: tripartite tricarboxylate transporter substrate binding protein [Burkholderiales bacterium]|nr:tripartite tricarboxylate transporter substrate binding protein [Burkholderiales bacterium]